MIKGKHPNSYRKCERLRSFSDFNLLKRNSKKLYCALFTLCYMPNGLPHSRLGVIVSKKVNKKAHVRNRMKRLVREIFRTTKKALLGSYDILVIPKKRMIDIGYHKVREQYIKLLSKEGCIDEKGLL